VVGRAGLCSGLADAFGQGTGRNPDLHYFPILAMRLLFVWT
jgi:hypothetical protein